MLLEGAHGHGRSLVLESDVMISTYEALDDLFSKLQVRAAEEVQEWREAAGGFVDGDGGGVGDGEGEMRMRKEMEERVRGASGEGKGERERLL